MAKNAVKILRKSVTWLLRILGFLLFLILLVVGFLQTQWGKDFSRDIAIDYLRDKLQTNISIDELRVEWLSHLRLKGVQLEDQHNRKLLTMQELDVTYDLSEIFQNTLTINDISIRGVNINLVRDRKDSLFNFSFIPAAFAGKESTNETTGPSTFRLRPGKISVSKLNFVMDDQYGGQVYQFSVASFKTNIDKLDLGKLTVHGKYFFTDSVNGSATLFKPFYQPTINTVEPGATPSSLTIGLDKVVISNSLFNFENRDTHLKIKTDAGLLAANNISYDQAKLNVTLGAVALLDHTTKVKMTGRASVTETNQSTPRDVNQPEKKDLSRPFTFAIKSIGTERNHLEFDVEASPVGGQKQVDFNHLALRDINFKASNTEYNGTGYSTNIHQLVLNEKSGFRLKQLKANVRYSDTGVSINQLSLSTTQNQLRGNVAMSYHSIGEITTRPSGTKIKAVISNAQIQPDELLYFQPGLAKNESFRPLLGKKFYINSTVEGTLDKLRIPTLSIKEAQTRVLASANIFNLPDIKRLLIDLKVQEFSGTRNELLSYLPPNTIADSLLHYIPQKFTLKGNYKGTMDNLYTDLQLTTSEGDVAIKGTLKNITDKNNAVYDIVAGANNLQLGKLLQDSLVGDISLKVRLKGKGYDLPTANTVYDAEVTAATYNGYTYHDISASGNINDNKLEVHLQSNDPNIEITTDTWYDMDKSRSSFRTNTAIANVDLLKLGFLKDSLVVKGNLNGDMYMPDGMKLDGEMLASGLDIQYQSHQVLVDSVSLKANYTDSGQAIQLTSPIADILLTGEYAIRDLPAAIKTVFNRYLYTNSMDTVYPGRVNANLIAAVHIPDSMLFLLPGLTSISPFSLAGSLNTDSSAISLVTGISKIKYDGYEIDTIAINFNSNPITKADNELAYGLTVQSITSASLNLANTAISGTVSKGIINGKLELPDEHGKPKYIFPYSILNDSRKPYLRIGDSLLIDKNYWSVNGNNIIYLNMEELMGSNLQISRNSSSIRLLADSTHASGLPLQLVLQQFNLENIAEMLSSDTTLMEGVAEGILSVQSLTPFSFTSDLQINGLRLKEVNTGNLSIKVSQQPGNMLLADVFLKGEDNDVTLNGTYNATDKSTALKLDIKQFNLQNMEAFVAGYLSKLTGKLKGGLTISGTPEQPEVRGSIKTDSALAVYRDYGTYILMPAAEISFEEDGINFNQFGFTDSAGHKGAITGKLFTKNYREFIPDLKIETRNFLAIDKKKYPDQMIYGPTWVDALVKIGTKEQVVVMDGSVKVIDKSSFTYIYSESESTVSGEGLFEFFDPSHPPDTLAVAAKKKTATAGMQIALNMFLNITPASTVNIVLDELTGDQLKIKGSANLNFTMSPGGQMGLTGNYIVDTGDYDLSIAQVIKKKFSIQKGSTISWSGDILKGEMNIAALYKVKTSAGELVKDIQSVPGIDKQKFNFEVYLFLKKELLKPDISFKLDMPPNEQAAFNDIIYNRIKQVNSIPAELNKQVMGLLVLNQFIADNPFSTATANVGSSLETQAFETAGNLLTNELTDLLSRAVKGVDIEVDLDVTEDYTSGTGQRNTDLKVGVSKSLAQNRLLVYVGSSIALEGQNQNTGAVSGLAGDFTLEYLLTTDGKYRLKGFHLNEDELSMAGTVVSTGVTFVVVLEFNRLKNILKKNKQIAD